MVGKEILAIYLDMIVDKFGKISTLSGNISLYNHDTGSPVWALQFAQRQRSFSRNFQGDHCICFTCIYFISEIS